MTKTSPRTLTQDEINRLYNIRQKLTVYGTEEEVEVLDRVLASASAPQGQEIEARFKAKYGYDSPNLEAYIEDILEDRMQLWERLQSAQGQENDEEADDDLFNRVSAAFWCIDKSNRDDWRELMRRLRLRLGLSVIGSTPEQSAQTPPATVEQARRQLFDFLADGDTDGTQTVSKLVDALIAAVRAASPTSPD